MASSISWPKITCYICPSLCELALICSQHFFNTPPHALRWPVVSASQDQWSLAVPECGFSVISQCIHQKLLSQQHLLWRNSSTGSFCSVTYRHAQLQKLTGFALMHSPETTGRRKPFFFISVNHIKHTLPLSKSFLHLMWFSTTSRIRGTSPRFALPPWANATFYAIRWTN